VTPALLDLMEHEKVIEQGGAAEDIEWCLARIREGEKYRAAGYVTFEGYLRDRWGLS
jgi:hypothetical protein